MCRYRWSHTRKLLGQYQSGRRYLCQSRRYLDGAQENGGGEALPQGGRLRVGLAPGVHHARLVRTARLHLQPIPRENQLSGGW